MTATTPNSDAQRAATRVLVGRLLRGYLRPHVGKLILAAAFMALAAASTAFYAWIMEPILDDVLVKGNRDKLLWVTIGVIGAALIRGFSTYFQSILMAFVGQRVIAAVQMELFAHLMRADIAYFQNTATGRLISNFLNDVNLLRESVQKAMTGVARDSLMVIFLVGVLFLKDWQLAIVFCVILPLAIFPLRNLGKRMRKASSQNQERTGEFSALLNESFVGARHVKAYGMEDYETARAGKVNEARLRAVFKVIRTRAAVTPIMEVLAGIAVAAIVYYGGTRVITGGATAGTFFAFITAMLLAYQPLKSLANLNTALQEGLAAAHRIFAMLDEEPAIKDAPDAAELRVAGGALRFENVGHTYDDSSAALSGVSFDVPAGETVALVGPSGAGKSTLLNLIPRFYDASEGSVLINDQDVRAVTQKSLRANIALVSQESSLFNDTVRANIAYGKPGANEVEIVAAAKAAAAHDFIMELPRGYDSVVGEGGTKVSGGQRQRIAIARAMLKDAPILLLDEATSALDSQAERKVQAALTELSRGRTTLVVAHRLSTVIDADMIHVIDGGQIRESGKHADLLARGGLYAKLYALQSAPGSGEPAERARA